MDNRYRYLLDLGYSEKDIDSYTHSWSERITSYLADHSDRTALNMQFLFGDFEPDLLLKLPVFFSDTFVMEPAVFQRRWKALISEFSHRYTEIMKKQIRGYEGKDPEYMTPDIIKSESLYVPYLEIMSHDENAVQEAITSLKNPSTRVYKFIAMLNKLGIDIAAADVDADALLDLEVHKWEVRQNAEFLLEQQLSPEIITDLLRCCPYRMMDSVEELCNFLAEQFGEEYAEVMPVKANTTDWYDILNELW